MPDLSERVARMEEQSDAHIRTMDYLRKDMSDLRHSMESLSGELRGEMGALSTALRGEMGALRAEMAELGTELRAEMNDLKTELRGEMQGLKTELRGEMQGLKTELHGDMAELERRFDRMDTRFNWLIGIVVTSSIATMGAVAGAFWGVVQALR